MLGGRKEITMATSTTAPTAATRKRLASVGSEQHSKSASGRDPGGYVVPLVHTRIPAPVVQIGFWGGLVATVAFGVIDPPLAALLGVGVVVARHRRDR
jgi:hypothetical protein